LSTAERAAIPFSGTLAPPFRHREQTVTEVPTTERTVQALMALGYLVTASASA